MASSDFDDDEAMRLRAIDREQRQQQRPHWCPLCHGHTGPDSPCYPGEQPQTEEEPSA